MKTKIKIFINYQEKKINCFSLKKKKISNQKSINATQMKMKLYHKKLSHHLKVKLSNHRFNNLEKIH